jgi:hypothetical protein
METAVSPYRLKVRFGNNEFEAEGNESSVREQFASFLEFANTAGTGSTIGHTNGVERNGSEGAQEHQSDADADIEGLWGRAYKRQGDQLSLHVLPQTKFQNPDALLLLLYGYQTLMRLDSVKSTDLMESAKQSGLRIDRIDRNLPRSHMAFVIKGGNGKGSRYSLNNRGLAHAQEMLEALFE